MYFMNISNGLSTINTASAKIYTWPKYDAGIINKIDAIDAYKRQTQEIYRATPESEAEAIRNADSNLVQIYNQHAKINTYRTAAVMPGSLFDAFA